MTAIFYAFCIVRRSHMQSLTLLKAVHFHSRWATFCAVFVSSALYYRTEYRNRYATMTFCGKADVPIKKREHTFAGIQIGMICTGAVNFFFLRKLLSLSLSLSYSSICVTAATYCVHCHSFLSTTVIHSMYSTLEFVSVDQVNDANGSFFRCYHLASHITVNIHNVIGFSSSLKSKEKKERERDTTTYNIVSEKIFGWLFFHFTQAL